jgi:hypothetical protein
VQVNASTYWQERSRRCIEAIDAPRKDGDAERAPKSRLASSLEQNQSLAKDLAKVEKSPRFDVSLGFVLEFEVSAE